MKEQIRLLRQAIMRSERRNAHETGHQTPREPELCYPDEVGGGHDNIFTRMQETPNSEEIVLFRQPGEIVNGRYLVVDKLPDPQKPT